MAPKKKEQQKMSLGDFLTEGIGGGGSWADEVEETYVPIGTQPLPPSDRARSGGSSMWQDRGYAVRDSGPATLPTKPPFTAHLGNLSYDATSETITEFFEGCDVANVRIIEDREMQRPKGFGYVEFGTLDGLKKALNLDMESFQGRMIKIKIADPPRAGDTGRGDTLREIGDWTRKGPLPDAPSRGGSGGRDFGGGGGGRDFGDRREPREPRDPAAEPRPAREMNWGERRGPLSPLSQQEGGSDSRGGSNPRAAPEGLGERGGSYRGERGERRQSPATWGEGRPAGAVTAAPERPARPERVPTAADKDNQWRTSMRPDAANASPAQEETPASPVTAGPPSRPRLNLAKRTVSEAPDLASPTSGDSKASPFGAAKPINTAAREKEIEEKRLQAIEEKREADEKAKEDKKLAKEAAAKAEAEAAEKAAEAEVNGADDAQKEATDKATENADEAQKAPVEREAPKTKATESNSWRSAPGGSRGAPGGPRGGGRGGAPRGARGEGRPPRANGPSQQREPTSPTETEETTVDADGWTTVKKGRAGRPVGA